MHQPMKIGNDRLLRGSRLGRGRRSCGSGSAFGTSGRRGRRRCGGRGRQGFHQLPAGAFRMRVEILDDVLQAVRHRRRHQIQEVRPRHRDVRDGFVDLKKLQTRAGKLLAQECHQLQREPVEVLDHAPRDRAQRGAQNVPRRRAIHLPAFDRLQQCGQMGLAKVLLDLVARRQLLGFGHVETRVAKLEALLLDPLLHHGFVPHDFHPRLERLKRHPAEPLGVQRPQLLLVTVIIRRPEQHPAHAALGDERVIPLRRFGRRFLRRVKRVEMLVQRVPHHVGLRQPQGVVEVEDEELLHWLTVGLLHHREPDDIALRFLQHQRGDLEHRIGAARQLDLAHQRFHALRLGENLHVQFWQLHLRLAWLLDPVASARIALPTVPAAAATRPAARIAPPARSRRPRSRAFPAALTAARTAPAAATPAKTSAATATAAAPSGAAIRAVPPLAPVAFFARDVLETAGIRRLRRPRGQEQVFQIELGLRSCTHAASSSFGRCVQSVKIRVRTLPVASSESKRLLRQTRLSGTARPGETGLEPPKLTAQSSDFEGGSRP